MTTPLNMLVPAACISLLLLSVPGAVCSQEQSAPTTTEAVQASEEPAGQGEGIVSIPLPEQQEAPATAPTTTALTSEETVSAEIPPLTSEEAAEEATAPSEAARPAEEIAETYTVKKGDTLWDISHALLKDPFLWPFIWKANPAIANPDLIYPGNKLAIPSMAPIEQALAAPAEAPKEALPEKKPGAAIPAEAEEAPAPPTQIILPEEAPIPLVDKYAMLSAGFVNFEEEAGRIVAPQEKDKTIMGYNDIVYVTIKNPDAVNVGDKFLIIRTMDKVKHPKTGERYGRLVRGLGILQIAAKDAEMLTARITLSFDAIEKDSVLTVYQEPQLLYPKSEKASKDITGYILEVTDKRTINGQTDVVYLDRGAGAGVEPGDTFIVYDYQEKRGFPKKMIGEVQVFLVKDRTSTAIVRKSVDTLAKGDPIEFKK